MLGWLVINKSTIHGYYILYINVGVLKVRMYVTSMFKGDKIGRYVLLEGNIENYPFWKSPL